MPTPLDFTSLVTIYGPLGLGWPLSLYLLNFILSRVERDVERNVQFANTMRELSELIKMKLLKGE